MEGVGVRVEACALETLTLVGEHGRPPGEVLKAGTVESFVRPTEPFSLVALVFDGVEGEELWTHRRGLEDAEARRRRPGRPDRGRAGVEACNE